MRGELKNGFKFDVPDEKLYDMETVDAISEIDDGNIFALSKLCKILFAPKAKKELYELCKSADGMTKPESVLAAIMEMFEVGGGKN